MMIMLSYWTVKYSADNQLYATRVILDDDPNSETYATMADVPKIIENSTGRKNVRQQIRH